MLTWPILSPETDVNLAMNASVYSVHDIHWKVRWIISVRYILVIGSMADRSDNFVIALIVLSAVFITIVNLWASDSCIHLLCHLFVTYDILTVLIIRVGIDVIYFNADEKMLDVVSVGYQLSLSDMWT